MVRLIGAAFLVSLSLTLAAGAQAQTPASAPPRPPSGLDVAAIDRAMGKSGAVLGDVYKVSLPRTDLNVTVGGVTVKAGFALGGWAAFKSDGKDGAVVHGDLVLLDAELNPVISGLQQHDFEITAIHNHLINETPSLKYVHYWGHGSAATLAANLKDALGHSKTPIAAAPAASGSQASPAAVNDDLPADAIQAAIGIKGTVSNGVLSLAQARPETIQMMGVTLPPSMGMATAINFQSVGPGRVATTGDFVMLADEVNKVARTLRANGIEIAALHNHMLHGSPELYFMHFWAVGDPQKIAAGLKAALADVKH
jgi:hypothetical protein